MAYEHEYWTPLDGPVDERTPPYDGSYVFGWHPAKWHKGGGIIEQVKWLSDLQMWEEKDGRRFRGIVTHWRPLFKSPEKE